MIDMSMMVMHCASAMAAEQRGRAGHAAHHGAELGPPSGEPVERPLDQPVAVRGIHEGNAGDLSS
jgi:hypothetical protein